MPLDTRLPLMAGAQAPIQFQPESQLQTLSRIAPAVNAMRQLQAGQLEAAEAQRKQRAFQEFQNEVSRAFPGGVKELAQVFLTRGTMPQHFEVGQKLMEAAMQQEENQRLFANVRSGGAAVGMPAPAAPAAPTMAQMPVSEVAPEMAMGATGGAQPRNAMMAMEMPAAAARPAAAAPAGMLEYGGSFYPPEVVQGLLASRNAQHQQLGRAIAEANRPQRETQPEKLRIMQALGFPMTAQGLADFEATQRSQQLPADYQNYLQAKKEGYAGNFFQYQQELRKAGATNVPINVSTEKKYGEAFGGKMAEVDINKFTAAEKAPQMAENANRIIELAKNPNIFVGPIADIKLNIARAFNVVGANNEETISNTEKLIAATGQSTLDAIKGAGLGAGQGFTDKDLKFLQGVAGGTVNLTAQTLTELAQIQHRAAVRAAEAWNKRSKEMPRDVAIGAGLSMEPIVVPSLATSAASRSNVAAPAGGRSFPQPTQAAIDALKRGQGTDAQFDAIFGPGAAARARGR